MDGPVLLPSFGTDSKPPVTDVTQTKFASAKYPTNTSDEEQSAGVDGTSIIPDSTPRNGKIEGGLRGLDTTADVPQMLEVSRQASWRPADDRNCFVEHSNKIATPARSEHIETRRHAKRTCDKCELYLTGPLVRTLEGTYHLLCFTCQVCFTSSPSVFKLTNLAGLRCRYRWEILQDRHQRSGQLAIC